VGPPRLGRPLLKTMSSLRRNDSGPLASWHPGRGSSV
jgi:hypothetical protein